MSIVQKGNPKHQNPYFWNACMETQVWEMKEACKNGDYKHWAEEVVDCILVGYDALRLMGFDAMEEILFRFAKNLQKDLGVRDTKFYEDKIAKLKAEVGENSGN